MAIKSYLSIVVFRQKCQFYREKMMGKKNRMIVLGLLHNLGSHVLLGEKEIQTLFISHNYLN